MNAKDISLDTVSNMPKGRIAMWLLITGELVVFGGVLASYILYRVRFPEWAMQAKHTSTLFGAINTFVLLTSSFTIVKAHAANIQRKTDQAVKWMLATILGGFIFLIIKGIEYSIEIKSGFTLTSPKITGVGSLFWSFYYFLTGLHAAHVIAGMVFIFWVMQHVKKDKGLHRIEYAGMYWHMVDLIWIFLFPLFYLAK